jgi:hypothetical protein
MLQVIVVILFFVVASLLALTIAGLSLSMFGKFLKRSERVSEEQEV